MTAELLCADCEDRLNRNGERWVLANGYRLAGPSKLYQLFSEASPLDEYASHTVYAGRNISGVDVDQLAYFGVSVFWRASVTRWDHSGHDGPLLSLGPYEDAIRTFLLGIGPFPTAAALWVAVMRTDAPPPIVTFPRGGSKGLYHQHNFDVPGLSFTLYVGKRLPTYAHELCAIHSQAGVVFFSPVHKIINERSIKLFARAKVGPALRKLNDKVAGQGRVSRPPSHTA